MGKRAYGEAIIVAQGAAGATGLTGPTGPTGADGDEIIGINEQSGTTYTLVLTDAGKLVVCTNAGDITVTVPLNSSVAFPVNTVISFKQGGAGQIIIEEGDSSIVIDAFGGLSSAGEYAGLSLVQTDTDVWTLFGGIA